MNEQDLIIQEKIKKREKTDIMLAYILIVILLGCILFIVYLKFTKKEDNNNVLEPTEYTVNYIKLEDIASNINNNLNTKYNGINASSNENNISISYGDLTYSIKLINNELEFNMDNDNKELSEDIYKDIVTNICIYYNKDVDGCKNAAKSITYGSNGTGIRFVDNVIYISITNGVTPVDVITYNEETIAIIDDTDYELSINNINISNIKVDMLDTNIFISGDMSTSGNVTVKLYDNDNNLLEEKTTSSNDNFSITFDYNDKLNINSIKKYSISVE